MKPIDLSKVPFSGPNTYLKITAIGASISGRVILATARDLPLIDMATQDSPSAFYEVILLRDGTECPYVAKANPWRVDLEVSNGIRCSLWFADADTFLFRGHGVSVGLLPCHSTCTCDRRGENEYALVDFRGMCIHQLNAAQGTAVSVSDTMNTTGNTGPYKDKGRRFLFQPTDQSHVVSGAIRFSAFGGRWDTAVPNAADVDRNRRSEWEVWSTKVPQVPERFRSAALAAWNVLWSATVPPSGRITRRAVLMSKNHMNRIWAWDNCFNALALADADPELALDQLRVLFDHQSPDGLLPEPLNEFSVRYGFVKPPIYGWCLSELSRTLPPQIFERFIPEAYRAIAAQTHWWMENRDRGQGVCEYHHGNDSGCDNATVFDQGYPTLGPDLSTYLILQAEELARLASLMGHGDESEMWVAYSKKMFDTMLNTQVRHDRFVAPLADLGGGVEQGCLLTRIPSLLGDRLPGGVRRNLIVDLAPDGPFVTSSGAATQAPRSNLYQANGYWRGPVWAPYTYFAYQGLVALGQIPAANELAERFCNTVASDEGMWENYDALSGKGLCCPAYTWTASVFLLLAQRLAQR